MKPWLTPDMALIDPTKRCRDWTHLQILGSRVQYLMPEIMHESAQQTCEPDISFETYMSEYLLHPTEPGFNGPRKSSPTLQKQRRTIYINT